MLQVYLPAVTLLASANFDVRELEKIWFKNMEDLQSSYSGAKSKNRRRKKVINYSFYLLCCWEMCSN